MLGPLKTFPRFDTASEGSLKPAFDLGKHATGSLGSGIVIRIDADIASGYEM